MRSLPLVCLLLLAFPAAASAGQVNRTFGSGSELTYTADTGGIAEADQLDVRMEGTNVVFEDLTLTLTQVGGGFGPNCTVENVGHRLRCPAAGYVAVTISDPLVKFNAPQRFTAAASFPLPLTMTSNAPEGGEVALTGGAAADTLRSCPFCRTTITGNGGNDIVTGGDTTDVFIPGAGADIVLAGAGEDTLRYDEPGRTGGVSVDLAINGNQGGAEDGPPGARDSVGQVETLVGTAFDDALRGCAASCLGLGGQDVLTGTAAANRLEGGAGNDELSGGGGDDDLLGADGDDRLRGGLGSDSLLGGSGTDTADYSDYQQPITIQPPVPSSCSGGGNAGEGQDRWGGGVVFSGGVISCGAAEVERAIGGAAGDTITIAGVAGPTPTADGGPGGDAITLLGGIGAVVLGGGGEDTINGGAGDDTLDGGFGGDRLDGNGGTDRVTYAGRAEGVVVTIGGVGASGSDGDGPLGARDTVLAPEVLEGGDGSDLLVGTPGPERLIGGPGDDTLRGLTGTDLLDGGVGSDRVDYSDRTVAVNAVLDGFANDGEPGENDAIAADIENLTGGSAADRLVGSAAANDLVGAEGSDAITGLSGADRLDAGNGDDTIEARDGEADVVACGPGNDTVTADTIDVFDQCEGLALAGVIPPITPPPVPPADKDGDGQSVLTDCNDNDAKIKPGAIEIPGNTVDENCDGIKAPYPTIGSTVTFTFRRTRTTTTFLTITVARVPKGSAITMKCKSRTQKACPFKSKRLAFKEATRVVPLGKYFRKRKLRAGSVVTITISAPETLSKVVRYTVRRGKSPSVKITCATPAGQTASC